MTCIYIKVSAIVSEFDLISWNENSRSKPYDYRWVDKFYS